MDGEAGRARPGTKIGNSYQLIYKITTLKPVKTESLVSTGECSRDQPHFSFLFNGLQDEGGN